MSTTNRRDMGILSFQNKSDGTAILSSDWINNVNKALEREQRECLDDVVVACELVKREVRLSKLE